ncbi:MAG: hypothetical protein QGF59_18390 [Pirellulaceae bacterium]|nr:hypothetical protein [Pirellulaceae bacterium]
MTRRPPHRGWSTIHETGEGKIDFERISLNGPSPAFRESVENFQKQSFQLSPFGVKAGLVDARIESANRIVIKTKNVRKLSVWLHPLMVDFSKPIRISLNGKESSHNAAANLLDAIRSYERRRDWSLTYHAEITLDCVED